MYLPQTTYHPNTKYYMLLGKMGKDISKQEVANRSKYVLPFVCMSHGMSHCFYNELITIIDIKMYKDARIQKFQNATDRVIKIK